MAEYEVLENLGFDRQLVRITTGDRAGLELVLVCAEIPGVERLEEFLGEAAAPVGGRLPPRLAAERLLCSLLDQGQREDWTRNRTFWVPTEFGPVQLGRLFNLRFRPWEGEPLTLCVVPDGFSTLPEADIWVNLLLALRADPRWFFTVANWRRRGGDWTYGPVPLSPQGGGRAPTGAPDRSRRAGPAGSRRTASSVTPQPRHGTTSPPAIRHSVRARSSV